VSPLLLPGNQLIHPFQKDLATSLALLGLVLGFGEGDLIHGSGEFCAVDDGRIIADFGDLFRGSLEKCKGYFTVTVIRLGGYFKIFNNNNNI